MTPQEAKVLIVWLEALRQQSQEGNDEVVTSMINEKIKRVHAQAWDTGK